MPHVTHLSLENPLSLSAGALLRLAWGLGVSALLWLAVSWALSA